MEEETVKVDNMDELLNRMFMGTRFPELDMGVIALDIDNLLHLNPEVVTIDNIWTVLCLLSLMTCNTGRTSLYKADVCSITCTEYSGVAVIEEVRQLFMNNTKTRTRETTYKYVARKHVKT